MSGEAFRPSLATRAALTLRDSDRGERAVSFDELHDLSPDAVREFAEALLAEGERRGLVVEYAVVESFAWRGLKFRWRPAR